MNFHLRTWLQLFRAPNLFTVPGDPLAGFLIASSGSFSVEVLFAIAASLCFYAAGLLDNDMADLTEDQAERPDRPLPSGAATVRSVWIVMCGLVLIGLFLCAAAGGTTAALGCWIVVAIGFYNHLLKRIPVIGALCMGLCRGLSVLLGLSAASGSMIPKAAIGAAVLIGLYIAAVTHLARFETRASSPVSAKWLPSLILICGLFSNWIWEVISRHEAVMLGTIVSWTLLAAAISLSVLIAAALTQRDSPAPLPPSIGKFIRLLLLIQAAFCALTGIAGLILAAFLLALYPVSKAVGKRFYAS